jgi:hypothetical protein
LSSKIEPTFFLTGNFGNDLRFKVDQAKGRIYIDLQSDKDLPELLVPVPETEQFLSGRFIYPQRLYALYSMRERVGERLADYGALADLTPPELAAVVAAVARAEKVRPSIEKTR